MKNKHKAALDTLLTAATALAKAAVKAAKNEDAQAASLMLNAANSAISTALHAPRQAK